jgi:putative inorganic carbon (hco3(-)) transporter
MAAINDVVDLNPVGSGTVRRSIASSRPLLGAYVALLLFMVVYFARPEDWIPGLAAAPLAKIAGVLALLAFACSLGQIRQRLPREVICLMLLIVQLFLAASLSPIWPGGAFFRTLNFVKVLLIVVVMALSVKTEKRLRLLVFVQAVSAAVIAAITVWKGRLLVGRLQGVLGNYSNPNELALAMVISLPLCLALLFLSSNKIWKAACTMAMLMMTYTVFLTASRAGFIALIAMTAAVLWEFGIQQRRYYLLALTAIVGTVLWLSSAAMLKERLRGIVDPTSNVASAYGSSEARQALFWRSVQVTMEHPLFGVGQGNFGSISGSWHVSHNSYTQMSSEGGIPALILYIVILWCGFENVRATKRRAVGQPKLKVLADSFSASMFGFVVGSCFDSVCYQFFPYFLIAYTTALFWIAKRPAAHFKNQLLVGKARVEDTSNVDAAEIAMPWHSC